MNKKVQIPSFFKRGIVLFPYIGSNVPLMQIVFLMDVNMKNLALAHLTKLSIHQHLFITLVVVENPYLFFSI